MITAIIADDESHARERLRQLLERFELFEIVGEAADGNEALHLIITRKPDVAFLDINMPGISVFSSVPSLQAPPLVVFQTAYPEHAAAAFDIEALDYLLKPVRFERLEKTVARIRESLTVRSGERTEPSERPAGRVGQVTVKSAGGTRVIAVEDIVRISYEDGFCYLYTADEKIISDKYLSYYEKKLKGGRFFRSSRTDIINLDHIAMIHTLVPGEYTIELKSGKQIDLSRRKAQLLRTIMDF